MTVNRVDRKTGREGAHCETLPEVLENIHDGKVTAPTSCEVERENKFSSRLLKGIWVKFWVPLKIWISYS